MAGLMDYLSNLKFEPDAKSMGLMNMAANMLQASNNSPTPVSFGNALGAGLNGFTGGYQVQKNLDDTAAAAEQKKLLDAATINHLNAQSAHELNKGVDYGVNAIHPGAIHEKNPDTDHWQWRYPDGTIVNDTNDMSVFQRSTQNAVIQGNIAGARADAGNSMQTYGDGSQRLTRNSSITGPYQGSQPQNNQLSSLEQEVKQKIDSGQITQEQGISILQQNASPGMAPNAGSFGQSTQDKASQTATGTATGEAQAKAQIDLPGSLAASEQLSKLTNEIANHPGLPGVVGMPNFNGVMPFPGTKEADFKARLDQLKGTAFLQAFEKLKGGGAVSEREGQQATAALARLQSSQTEKEFKNSLQDFNNVMAGVTDRLKVRANGGIQQPQAPQSQPSIDDLVNHYGAK